MTGVVWLNGKLVGADEARLSPFDHGLLVGDGVFETCKVVDSVPFALRRHLDRLARSAAGLGLDLPDPQTLRDAAAEVIAVNAAADPSTPVGRLRITVTGGPAPLGSGRGEAGPTVLLISAPDPRWEPTTTAVTVPWPRNERSAIAGLKTISYAENVVALDYASERGATEAIMPNTVGNLCEGTGTNVFVGVDGRLVTPPLSAGCLAGITRELLLEVTDAVEQDVPMAAIATVDEAFLASSTREVQPVTAIDGRVLPDAPGPLTAAAARAFASLVVRDLDP